MITKLGVEVCGGIGDCLQKLGKYHSPLLPLINRGKTPYRWWMDHSKIRPILREFLFDRLAGFTETTTDNYRLISNLPRWNRFLIKTRTPLPFRLTDEEQRALPRFPESKPLIVICPHQTGLLCKALLNDSLAEVLSILHRHLDAHFCVIEQAPNSAPLAAEWLDGLNLTQAIEMIGRADALLSVDSWHKYIASAHHIPQSVLMVDFRVNETFTMGSSPREIWQIFFDTWFTPQQVLGFTSNYSAFLWKKSADIPPALIAQHFLTQLRLQRRFDRFWKQPPTTVLPIP